MTPVNPEPGAKTIAVIGGGFVGSHIGWRAQNSDFRVRLVSRHPSSKFEGVELIEGEITTGTGFIKAFTGAEIVVNAVGIIKEKGNNTFEAVHHQGVLNIIEACRKANVRRLIQISALGVSESQTTPYFATKYKAEQAIISSGLEYVIFRPSVLFGPGDGFVNMLAGIMRLSPIFPIFGDGLYRLQPVSIYNLAESVVKAFDKGIWDNKIYSVCGPEKIAYIDIVKKIADKLGKKLIMPRIPFGLVTPPIKMAEIIGIPIPLTSEQLSMLKSENLCENLSYANDFGIKMIRFDDGIGEYL
jgi:NADH dehydrogenase